MHNGESDIDALIGVLELGEGFQLYPIEATTPKWGLVPFLIRFPHRLQS